MRRAALAFVLAMLCATSPAFAGHGHGGGGHVGGWHGWGGRPGGGGWHHDHGPGFGRRFLYDPWFWDPFFFPYVSPYYYYPPYVPPPDDEVPDARSDQPPAADAEDPLQASYGLVQLRGVPDGASIELDGWYWLRADRLAERWLALPRGGHTITMRPDGAAVVQRRVDIEPGTKAVVQFRSGR
jgi:hypothetical protein